MTRTVVDTSALIALLYPDDAHNDRAATLFHEASEDGALLINPVVSAELAADPFFESVDALDAFLDDTGITVDGLSTEVALAAGTAFQSYLDRRGEDLQCSQCGHETTFSCPACGGTITARQHIASDFLIGAHAETADALLTFDQGFFRDYFDVACRTVRE